MYSGSPQIDNFFIVKSFFPSIFAMPLFRDRPVRSISAAALAIFIGHYMTKLISSSHAFHLTQTSIAVVSIALLVVMITMHHRMEGQLLTQTQEEAVLIGGFVLLWIAVLVAWRAFTTKNVGGSQTLAEMPSPCSSDVGYCIVEEYYY